jgi:hypothetical protein
VLVGGNPVFKLISNRNAAANGRHQAARQTRDEFPTVDPCTVRFRFWVVQSHSTAFDPEVLALPAENPAFLTGRDEADIPPAIRATLQHVQQRARGERRDTEPRLKIWVGSQGEESIGGVLAT